jgi:uncharacterized protein YndB with AHSA1/START domain
MNPITIQTTINAPIEMIWNCWNDPDHITKWAFASDDWEAPEAENDIRTGGTFRTVMAAKDGSAQFDFGGTYTNVVVNEQIEYTMGDTRTVSVQFETTPEGVRVTETFDPETENPEEMQRAGWQAILDNFKKHVESEV